MFGYKPKSFWDLQAGLGLFNIRDYTTYSISTALTYNILLNPFRRKECWPHPGYNSFEAYLEGGAAIFVLDKYVNSYFAFNDQQKVITPLGLAGLRFHFISERWIYILKVRYTPSLIESKLASVAGVALGIGWR